jgi:DNA/RNA endonuclease G (NUC1)
MKTRIVSFIFAMAAAAAVALSCNTREPEGGSKAGVVFNVTSEKPSLAVGQAGQQSAPAVKTAWNGSTVQWSKNDAISLALTVDGVWQGPSAGHASIYPSDPLASDAETAQFKVPTDLNPSASSSYEFFAVCPAVGGTDFSGAPNVTLSLPAVQTPPSGSFAPEADLMRGHSVKPYTSLPENVSIVWERLVAHGDITLKSLSIGSGEALRKIILTAQTGAALSGTCSVNITDGSCSVSGAGNALVINADNLSVSGGQLEFWAVMLPVTVTSLTVTVDTDKALYTRTIDECSLEFRKNMRNTLTINMGDAVRTEKVQYYEKVTKNLSDWSGEYLIVYEEGSVAMNGALSTYDAAGNSVSVTIDDGKVKADAAAKAAAFTFAGADGGYSIKGTSGKYFGNGSNSNGLQTSATPLSNTITYSSSGGALIKGSGGAYLRYNKAQDQKRFRYYKYSSYTGQEPVQLYKLTAAAGGDAPEVPVFEAVLTTLEATSVTSVKATLNASYSGVNLANAPQNVVFKYGTSRNELNNTVGNISVSEASGTYSWTLTDLTPGQQCWFKASMSVWNPVSGAYQTIEGEVLSFTTDPASSSPTELDWPELPALDYTHYTTGGNYYIDNTTHGGKYKNGSLYYTHHWSSQTYPSPSTVKIRNYTVCWSSDHICPVWVAAPRHSIWEDGGSSSNRNYVKNPDMPASVQYTSNDLNNTSYTRGHMLGAAERSAIRSAFTQVNYFTNIAPQALEYFNTGGGGWNNLEDWVDKFVCSDTLYVVVGTIFGQITDGYGNTASPSKISYMSTSNVSCPTAFYYLLLRTKGGNTGKSVKDCSASELKCAAFLRANASGTKGQKVTSAEMKSVAEIENLTGFTFFDNVPNAPKSSFNASDWGL